MSCAPIRARTCPIASELPKLSAQMARPIVPSSVSTTPSRSPTAYRSRAMSSSLILRWCRRMPALGVDQHGGVVQPVARPLDEPGGDVDPVLAGGLGQALGVRAGDRPGQVAGRGVGPAQVQALGQDDQAAALGGGLADGPDGPAQVGVGLAPLDQDLGHAGLEVWVVHAERWFPGTRKPLY